MPRRTRRVKEARFIECNRKQLVKASSGVKLPDFFLLPTVSGYTLRRVIYTTNAVESVNMSLRKIIKNRGSFPTDEAALKLLYLALRNITARWTMPIKDWRAALNRFAIIFEDRMPAF